MSTEGRRALLVGSPRGTLLGVGNDVAEIEARLADRGFACATCHGPQATRAGILAALEALVEGTREGEAVVFFYSGHGGRAKLFRPEAPEQELTHNYLVPMDHDKAGPFRGIADFELTMAFHALTRVTPNVTAIFECCHSAIMIRDGVPEAPLDPGERVRQEDGIRRFEMPDELRRAHDRYTAMLPRLDPRGSPRVVRLVATAAASPAFEGEVDGRPAGYFTAELCAALDEDTAARSSWDRIIRRVRERVLSRRRSDTQRPEAEGPTARLPFSLQTERDIVDRTTLVHTADGRTWIRAGRMHGVRKGDELAVLEPDGDASAKVVLVELFEDHALVELVPTAAGRQRTAAVTRARGGSVVALASHQERREVWLDEAIEVQSELRARLSLRARLRVTDDRDAATFRVHATADGLRVEGPPWLHRRAQATSAESIAALARDLDLLARRSILEETIEAAPGLSRPIDWAGRALVSLPGETAFRPLEDDEVLPRGTRLHVELSHSTRARATLYLNVINLGVSGRAILLNPAEPGGVQLPAPEGPGTVRIRLPRTRWWPLDWPGEVPPVAGLRDGLVFVASQRPLDLRTLVAADPPSPGEPDLRAGTNPDDDFGTPLRWAVQRLAFRVQP